jgi:hypothetical protein
MDGVKDARQIRDIEEAEDEPAYRENPKCDGDGATPLECSGQMIEQQHEDNDKTPVRIATVSKRRAEVYLDIPRKEAKNESQHAVAIHRMR